MSSLSDGGLVYEDIQNQQAQHAAIVASSVPFCAQLKANPATLQSATYGWPSPADTIAASVTSMQTYEAFWQNVVKVAPDGIRQGAQQVATTAQNVIDSVDDADLNDG